MVFRHVIDLRRGLSKRHPHHQEQIIDSLLRTRNIHNIQTIVYESSLVRSLDIDPTNNFLLVGISNGLVELQGIQDSCTGQLEFVENFAVRGRHFLRRVQWLPDPAEQLFSVISTGRLLVVNPATMVRMEQYKFKYDLLWSDWNPIELNLIAVCGTESTSSLVDLRAGNALQTITIHSPSGLKKHTANRCLWSKQDSRLLLIGDNDGLIYMYDIRNNMKPLLTGGGELGEINCMSFTQDESSIITTHGNRNRIVKWQLESNCLQHYPSVFREEPTPASGSTNSSSNENNQSTNNSGGLDIPESAVTPFVRFIRGRRRRTEDTGPNTAKYKTFLGSQFHLSSRHLYCPVRELASNNLNDFNIYDLKSGYRVKSIRTDETLMQGAFSVAGLQPESMVIYTGGMEKLRVWSFDELNQLREQRISSRFHTSDWSSDSEDYR